MKPEKPAPFVGESGQRRLDLSLLPNLHVMLLPVDRPTLMIEPVLRLDAFAWRESAAVDAVAHNRAMNTGCLPLQATRFDTRQLAAAGAVCNSALLMDLASLNVAARKGQSGPDC
ncbi:MAG: hypothetical protein WD733_11205 [Bryobacterales bacterium]